MEEKKYLKWYNKIGYGSGDIAGNVVYAFLTSFMMVYLTDSVGLAAGVVGTLIAVSKLFEDVYKRQLFLLGQGPVLHCGVFRCSEKRNFEKQINHLLCGWLKI